MRNGIGAARVLGPPPTPSPLQLQLHAALAALVEEANRGEPIWWRQSAWAWGLPTWSASGRPFRGLAALLLWRAAADWTVPAAWQQVESLDVPGAVVVPTRAKRDWVPIIVAPGPRLGPLSFPVPKWDDTRVASALTALRIDERPTLAPVASKVHELAAALVQALRRRPAPSPLRHGDWTVQTLSVSARIAALVADAAYAAQVGTVFSDEAVWQRSDIAALFPWESQDPGGPTAAADRVMRRTGARVLVSGHRPGQLPMRHDAVLRLDRAWERGRVLAGYGRVLQLSEALGLEVTGEAVLDARSLGLALALKAARLEDPFEGAVDDGARTAWQRLKRRVARRSWAHRLHVLRYGDIHGDPRWSAERILPQIQKVLTRAGPPGPEPAAVSLADLGLVRLLDAMGPNRPSEPARTEAVATKVGAVVDRSYQRHAVFKIGGGLRWLDIPNPTLARAQRRLVHALRPGAPFAGVATAFEPGRSPAFQARVHEGAVAAVVLDVADFFGSIRPRHLRWAFHPRPGAERSGQKDLLLAGGSREARESLLLLLFAGEGPTRWLPQGAPSSPWAANLAAHPMDRCLRAWARDWGPVRYSRYADDLALSLHSTDDTEVDAMTIERFLTEAERALRTEIQRRGWRVREEKTRRWRRSERTPLTLCGIEVPGSPGAPCRLPRAQHDRARAALHRLRCGDARWDHGLLAWAWSATGQPGWLAWSSPQVSELAVAAAGPILAEALVAGWGDSVDRRGTDE